MKWTGLLLRDEPEVCSDFLFGVNEICPQKTSFQDVIIRIRLLFF